MELNINLSALDGVQAGYVAPKATVGFLRVDENVSQNTLPLQSTNHSLLPANKLTSPKKPTSPSKLPLQPRSLNIDSDEEDHSIERKKTQMPSSPLKAASASRVDCDDTSVALAKVNLQSQFLSLNIDSDEEDYPIHRKKAVKPSSPAKVAPSSSGSYETGCVSPKVNPQSQSLNTGSYEENYEINATCSKVNPQSQSLNTGSYEENYEINATCSKVNLEPPKGYDGSLVSSKVEHTSTSLTTTRSPSYFINADLGLSTLETLQEIKEGVQERIVAFVSTYFAFQEGERVTQYLLSRSSSSGKTWTVYDLSSELRDNCGVQSRQRLKLLQSEQIKVILAIYLGQGCFKEVTKAFFLGNASWHAFIQPLNKQGAANSIDWEIKIMRLLRDIPQVLQLTHVFTDSSGVRAFMTELMDSSLEDYLKGKTLNSQQKLAIAGQMIGAVAKMHERRVIHSDIKIDNFLAKQLPNSNDVDVKIADFGLSFPVDEDSSKSISMNRFQASPEILDLARRKDGKVTVNDVRENLTFASDVWMLGTTLYELFTGKKSPWEAEVIAIFNKVHLSLNERRAEALAKIQERLPGFVEELKNSEDPLVQFLVPFFKLNPQDRISAEQALDAICSGVL